MANEKKINAIADAEQAGLYYSSNLLNQVS